MPSATERLHDLSWGYHIVLSLIKVSVTEPAFCYWCRTTARLLREVKAHRAYRPTTDAGGGQQALLGRFAVAVIDHCPALAAGKPCRHFQPVRHEILAA